MRSLDQTQTRASRLILVIEEQAARRERWSDLFRHHGLAVIAVHSSERAMAVLKHERPRVILADVKRSDTTGRELAEQIRAFDARVPIILIGNGHQSSSKTPLAREIQAFLPNDVSDELLIKEVDRWLTMPQPARHERWPGTILVVDDEPKLRAVLQDHLQRHGFTVITAALGKEALEQFTRCSPTIVLLDIKMPGMDGLLTLKQLKVMQRDVIVIMMTGVEDEALMTQALALGASDYLTKPFNFEYLETALLSKILTGPTP